MDSPAKLLIFLSCGTPHNKLQEDFIAAVEALLESHNCTPQTVGRSVYSARQPVEASRDLISACNGAVVIAFERTRTISGFDKPDSPGQKEISGERHPTVWNQMEAAMAYTQRVPILTLIEAGLKRQGMLSDRFEWKAMVTDLNPSFLITEEFRQVFSEWLASVRNTKKSMPEKDIDLAELKIGKLLGQLSLKQVIAVSAGALAVAGSMATLGFNAGQKWQETTMNATAPSKALPPSSPSSAAPRP